MRRCPGCAVAARPDAEHLNDCPYQGRRALPLARLSRGRRYDSRRYEHERTGAPMPAYVVEGYVIEKARRDWDARAYRGSAGNPRTREWWEVRRQGASLQPGCSIGRHPLHQGDTLRECLDWIAETLDKLQTRTGRTHHAPAS